MINGHHLHKDAFGHVYLIATGLVLKEGAMLEGVQDDEIVLIGEDLGF